MAATTTTTLAELIPQIESEARYWLTGASLFFPGQGQARQFLQLADLRRQPGVSYRFNKFAAITAGDAEEGVDYTTTQALDTDGMVVTATEKAVIVPVTDMSREAYQFGGDRLIQEAGRAIGMAMASKVDSDVFALFTSLSASLTASGDPVTHADFQHHIAALRTNKAPMPYAAIFHPWGWYEFVTEANSPVPDASKSGQVGESIWATYQAGNIMGVDCFEHPDIPTANAGVDYSGAFLSPWAIGMVLKADLRIEPERDASARLTELVGVMTYGVGVIDSTMGFSMLQDAD